MLLLSRFSSGRRSYLLSFSSNERTRRFVQDFLETLEDLDLSYNNLVDVPWETVALLVSVNTLSLDHNLIESVPEGIFSNLHKLAR